MVPTRETNGAAEDTVDEGVDGAVQGWQVLNDHRGVESFLGVWKEAEVVQNVKEEVRTPTADEGKNDDDAILDGLDFCLRDEPSVVAGAQLSI